MWACAYSDYAISCSRSDVARVVPVKDLDKVEGGGKIGKYELDALPTVWRMHSSCSLEKWLVSSMPAAFTVVISMIW
jgi:hypothetical protein